MLNGVNQYARNVLRRCLAQGISELPDAVPPPGWPQPGDDPEKVLEWIRTRPWDRNVWGAGSHGMRMATWLLRWHKEGRMTLDPVVQALNFFYRIQDPETGLWGTANQPQNVRINGTFKLFPLLRDQLDLPLPHADKIIDQVLAEFSRPGYDEAVGACDEWDNWYVMALAVDPAGGHRREDIIRMAGARIERDLDIFSAPDGGLSYWPSRCGTGWIGFDMAPSLPQGDASGLGILVGAINVCVDLLGLQDLSPWTGQWRLRGEAREDEALRQAILERLEI
jgi:hypothetical protein